MFDRSVTVRHELPDATRTHAGEMLLRYAASLFRLPEAYAFFFFFLNIPPPPEIHPLPHHAPLPISPGRKRWTTPKPAPIPTAPTITTQRQDTLPTITPETTTQKPPPTPNTAETSPIATPTFSRG